MSTLKKESITDHQFQWDPLSAGKKFFYNSDITLSVGVVSVTKNTGEHNKEKDAYRNCIICGKHYNYHKHD
jgi:hypothetical protein